MSIIKPTMSTQIAQYIKNHPNAKADAVAKALGTTTAYVYVVTSKMKAKAKKEKTITKKAIDERLKLAKIEGEKKLVRVSTGTSNQYITAHVDQITNLTDEQRERLIDNLNGRERLRAANRLAEAQHITMVEPKIDSVNHPAHYKVGGVETIDFIEAKGLGYNLGNVVKYVTRADHKGNTKEDLLKARWYLNREIAKLSEAV